jgi:hypothetical protein
MGGGRGHTLALCPINEFFDEACFANSGFASHHDKGRMPAGGVTPSLL